MKRMSIIALAMAMTFAGCGDSASAQNTRKTTKAKPKARPSSSAADLARMMEGGGAVGCPNSGLSGRTARVAARLRASGNDCTEGYTTEPAPKAAVRPAITAAWLVGTWGLGGCASPEFFRRIRADGRFSTADEVGTWRLSSSQPVATFSYRREGDAPDRALRVDDLAVARDAAGRLQLNVGWWTRCSRDPNAPIQ